MHPAAPLGKVFIELVTIVKRLELEHITKEELVGAEEEGLELTWAERLRSESKPLCNVQDGLTVVDLAVIGGKLSRLESRLGDAERHCRPLEAATVTGLAAQGLQACEIAPCAGECDGPYAHRPVSRPGRASRRASGRTEGGSHETADWPAFRSRRG